MPWGWGWLHFWLLWHGWSCITLQPNRQGPLKNPSSWSQGIQPLSPPSCKHKMPHPAAWLEGPTAGGPLSKHPDQPHDSSPRQPSHPRGDFPAELSKQAAPDMLGLVQAALPTFFQAQRAPTLSVSPGPLMLEGWDRRKVSFSLPSPPTLPQGGLHGDPHAPTAALHSVLPFPPSFPPRHGWEAGTQQLARLGPLPPSESKPRSWLPEISFPGG